MKIKCPMCNRMIHAVNGKLTAHHSKKPVRKEIEGPICKASLQSLTTLLALAIKHENARTSKVKLVTRLQAGKVRKQMYKKEITTKTN